MSEELAENTESPEASTENVSHETNDNQEQRPAGYDPVDLSGLDPGIAKSIEDRFGYFFKQVKEQKRALGEYRGIAQQQSQLIEDLRSGVGMVVDHLETRSAQETESSLRQKMQDAFDSGDNKAYVAAQQELSKYWLDQGLKKQQPQQVQKPQGRTSASSMAQEGVQDGDISPQDAQLIDAWQNESNERGEPLRPWAQTEDPSKPSPDFVKALFVANRFVEDNPGANSQQVLAHVDKEMGTKSRQQSQTVMGGRLTTPSKNQRMTLSTKQQEIAVRTKFGSKDGAKSEAEYIAAYRKQIEKVQSTKRSR